MGSWGIKAVEGIIKERHPVARLPSWALFNDALRRCDLDRSGENVSLKGASHDEAL